MNILMGRCLLALILVLGSLQICAQEKRAMEVSDIMKFQQIKSPSISDDGLWVSCAAVPDRGDPQVLVYSTDGKHQYEIARGKNPVISKDGKWVAMVQSLPAIDQLISDQGKDEKKKTGMILLNTSSGEQQIYENIRSFSFSNNSSWLICQHHAEKEDKKEGEKKNNKLQPGTALTLMNLEEGSIDTLPFVST
jgi:Tol biopolymer transport system component